ncbi:Nuclear import protein mog1 [Colletotrichum gloeosporioides]|uniref:Nuclear import protein mog1 n=1 Tax=Colletotrichum gloeosporioides TaxID=474922 RepID=A0A8H4CBP0_COLGL|nr:Nuclear import protein mog1 [Colletotrichum gloeosporioides]KAF3801073.1 Nuclear import protein mog1 [Colletotrichum gloeosporioides]
MTRYKSTPLYGGALVCDLPEKFADVSKLREVPDNQEVWIDQDGFTSIIFDITERVGPAGSSPEIDGRAMTTHLEELVGEDIDTVKVWNTTETSFSRLRWVAIFARLTYSLTRRYPLSSTEVPAYTLIATQTPKSKSGSAAPDFTAIILTLLRLEKESTDILITINVPHIKGEYDEEDVDLELGKQGKLIGDAVEYAARIWETFKVKDWTLFAEV